MTTKIEAKILGLSKYNPVRECKYGHAKERYTNSGMCVECVKMYKKRSTKRLAPTDIVTVKVKVCAIDALKIEQYAEALRVARTMID